MFLLAQTLKEQLEGHEEQFAEFDKKSMGLELRTAPLSLVCPRGSPTADEGEGCISYVECAKKLSQDY